MEPIPTLAKSMVLYKYFCSVDLLTPLIKVLNDLWNSKSTGLMPLLPYLTNGFDVKGHQNHKMYELQDRLC